MGRNDGAPRRGVEDAATYENSDLPMKGRGLHSRWASLAAMDLVLWILALSVAFLLRLDFDWTRVAAFEPFTTITLALVFQVGMGVLLGIYRGKYRLGSFEEAGRLMFTGIGAGLLLIGWSWLTEIHPVPAGTVAAATGYQVSGSVAIRYLARLLRERRVAPGGEPTRRVLIFGAGEAGYLVAKALSGEPGGRNSMIVGFLDDDPSKRNLRLAGHRVLGTRKRLEAIARATRADTLLIAMPTAPRRAVNAIADTAQAVGLEVHLMPPLAEIISGTARAVDAQKITLTDFLSRDEIHLDHTSVRGFLEGKRVMVTGAGGSIGAEICKTVLSFNPAVLVKVDHSERALYELEMAIKGTFSVDGTSVLADVRDSDRILTVVEEARPDVIFHAAAHKHVPFLEAFPAEGYRTNVVGTHNVLRAAEKVGVGTFVNISTDKAADPINVLGYTKRLAERLTSATAVRTGETYMSVRFGNVLGSHGSVVGTFRDQIRRNEKLTITHPDVTRYFMTISEAVQLVLQAASIGEGGEVMVLDMGEPLRVTDLATRLMAELRPGTIPEFEIVGLRAGEKLNEVLVSPDDRPLPSDHPLLHRFQVPPIDDSFVLEEEEPSKKRIRRLAEGRLVAVHPPGQKERSTR